MTQAGRERLAVRHVEAWNRAHPPGIKVSALMDDGTRVETTTQSLAWQVCGRAVILIGHKGGAYLIERLRPL